MAGKGLERKSFEDLGVVETICESKDDKYTSLVFSDDESYLYGTTTGNHITVFDVRGRR